MASRRKKSPVKSSSSPELPNHDLTLIPGYDPNRNAGLCTYDPVAGNDPIEFFEHQLIHVKGSLAGEKFILQPWQKSVIANLFGWKRPDGTRRYRETLIYVPRKSGKTPLAAGIGAYVLFCDKEPGAENYVAAVDREQAGLVYGWTKKMIQSNPALSSRCEIYVRSIVRTDVGSFFKVLSAEAPGKHGQNAHLVIIDELHAQPNREMVDVLTTSTGARRQPLIIYLTTADFDRESICNEKYEYACKVRDGVIDDPYFLPVIYESLPDADWKDPEIWKKSNPNFGISVPEDYFVRQCQQAQESPAYENTFKRLHLNMKTEQDVRWLPIDKWDACLEEYGAEDLEGKLCYGGLDLSSTEDISAFVLVFPSDNPEEYVSRVLPFFFSPRETAQVRERRDRVPYISWSQKGLIELTDGNAVDYDVIRKRIGEIGQRFHIKEIAFDKWNAQQLCNQLTGDGFNMVVFGQGFASMSGPTKELERLILDKHISHNGNAILRWMAGNISQEIDAAGNVKPSKKKSSGRIDGIVALIMAIGRMSVGSVKSTSIYDRRLREGKSLLSTL